MKINDYFKRFETNISITVHPKGKTCHGIRNIFTLPGKGCNVDITSPTAVYRYVLF